MKKEARVHRLPTEDKTSIEQYAEGYLVFYSGKKKSAKCDKNIHLYITTDKEIKEGDWFYYNYNGGVVGQYKKGMGEVDGKIIATTDPKIILKRCSGCEENIPLRKNGTHSILNEGVGLTCTKKTIPQIPQSFIEEYCKAGGIDKVLVEFEEYTTVPDIPNTRIRLKLDSNNCIIIHPVEEKMYSNEEVISKMNKYRNDMRLNSEFFKKYGDIEGGLPALHDKWIEENL